MKAAFLIRCSTKNQDLDRQTRDLTRLAKSLGYEYDIENLVFGEKITGKDDVTIKNRESIDKLLRAAKEQKFDVVLWEGVMHLKMNANILVILHSELTVHILNMIWIIRN